MARTNNIARIHILKAQLQWDDAQYRMHLEAVTGKRSAKDLNWREQQLVLGHMEGLVARTFGKPDPLTPMQRKVIALWKGLGNKQLVQDTSPRALNAWVKTQLGVDALRFCDTAQCSRLVEQLKQWSKRAAHTDTNEAA